MKVYLVFQGSYSSRTCRAVFDNKEQAEKYSELLDKEDSSDIEEFEVNAINTDSLVAGQFYGVTIFLKDFYNHKKGDLYKSEFYDVLEMDKNKGCKIKRGDDYIFVCSSISEEHTKKVAIEQYQIYTQQELENGEV